MIREISKYDSIYNKNRRRKPLANLLRTLFRFGMEVELMLTMEGMSLERGGREGTKFVQLKITLLACEPFACTVLLATSARKELREQNFG